MVGPQLSPAVRARVLREEAVDAELFLGGLANHGSDRLLARQGETVRATVGGYFQLRLPSPYSPPASQPQDFITRPHDYPIRSPRTST